MVSMKKIMTILGTCLLMGLTTHAYADNIGIVDIKKVTEGYSKAQDLDIASKDQEAELQKFLNDAQKQIKNAKTPLEGKNLEERYAKQFQAKYDAYKAQQEKDWQAIDNSIYKAIDTVSTQKKLGTILRSEVVIKGGVDITDDILKILNGK